MAKPKGWREHPDASGKAPRHRAVQTKKKLSSTARTPMKLKSPYSGYTSHERRIAEMLTENTGIHFLDSGGASGRAWQRNQGRDFKNEPATSYKIYKDGQVIISFNLFHYLKEYTALTPECRKLQSQFMKFARSPENADESWFASVKKFATIIDDGSAKDYVLSGTVNTYNYDTILSQDIEHTGFSYNGKGYILLMIHNGADARGGYTAPQVFEVPEGDYFLMAQNDVMASDEQGHRWSSDNGGSNWSSDADDEESGELEIEERNGKAHHKGCGAELEFSAMESH